MYDLEIHQKISEPDYQKLKTMVKRSTDQKLKLRNFDARIIESKKGHWLQIAGVNVVLKEDQEFAINGKQKGCVREETSVVSGTTG